MVMSLSIIKNTSFLKELIFKVWLWDARFKLERIAEYISPEDKVLDIGTGPGSVSLLMKRDGYNLTPIDVENQTLTQEIDPQIYDGKNLPYKNSVYDSALLLTVLHHTDNPKEVLSEAKRVANKLVVIEDIYTNPIQKYLTYFVDSIVNLEFSGHPHSNKSDNEWKDVFSELGLKLKEAKYDRFLLFFKQAVYYLEK